MIENGTHVKVYGSNGTVAYRGTVAGYVAAVAEPRFAPSGAVAPYYEIRPDAAYGLDPVMYPPAELVEETEDGN